MPELPEVQTVVDDLAAAGFAGAEITRALVFWRPTVSDLSPAAFRRRIAGRRIVSIRRRGKYIIFGLGADLQLLIHLRMSGRLLIKGPREPRLKHEHLVLVFSDRRELRFHDTRKFGRFYLVADPQPIIGKLGPEPLASSFSAARFGAILQGRRRMIKSLLLDQSAVAGIGNIYADESLWEARVHPRKAAAALGKEEVRALHRAVRKVLRRGLKNMGTSLGGGAANFFSIAGYNGRNREELKVFRRTGLACPRCGAAIERIIVAQRSTHICRTCQQI